MAIYHFHGKAVCRSKGHSAVAAAAYRAGEKLFDERRDCIHDYRPRRNGMTPATGAAPEGSAVAAAAYRAGAKLMDERHRRAHDYRPRSGVAASFILTPPQASAWMSEREALWNSCEAIERRKDSCVARELEVALPRELSLDAHIALVTGFVLEQLISRGVVADVAIHQGPARDGGTNPHAHILFTTRPVLKDGSGFSKKDRGLERRETLAQWREFWQDHINRALNDAGETARVDHRTLAQQGSARTPAPTLNRRLLAMEQRGLDTQHGERWRAESHATGLLTAEPLTDTATCLAAAAQLTPPQSRTHGLLSLASQALGRKG
jgi:ATP-dependent exoDNAse (exonuclease V) alpha subunit